MNNEFQNNLKKKNEELQNKINTLESENYDCKKKMSDIEILLQAKVT